MKDSIDLLAQKISREFHITNLNFSDLDNPIDIILTSYAKAVEIFNPKSENCIATSTLLLYMTHMDEALDIFTQNMSSLYAATSLLLFFIRIQALISDGTEALQRKFSQELINNKNYYTLFPVDYYLELTRTNGINTALNELEEDINIRAHTYYKAAYKDYLDILPGLEELISKYQDNI